MTIKRARTEEMASIKASWISTLENTKVHSNVEEGTPFICTHHGQFHCDEVVAIAMLKSLEEFKDLPVVRTRDQAVIDRATIVVDVGSAYDPENNRLDHHQAPFQDTYPGRSIRLSSAGLTYLHFGKRVVEAISGQELTKEVVDKIYDNFVLEVDAIDNGVEAAESLKYRVRTGLGTRVKRLNPSWLEENSPQIENERFVKALLLVAEEIYDQIHGVVNVWLPARKIVEEAYGEGGEEVLVLSRFCPWQEHLEDVEKKATTLYVLFQDVRGSWRIQAVPKELGSFENRKPLPKAWRGLRDEELSTLSGIPGCVFVHASGFIGGNATKEGALLMAQKACDLE